MLRTMMALLRTLPLGLPGRMENWRYLPELGLIGESRERKPGRDGAKEAPP